MSFRTIRSMAAYSTWGRYAPDTWPDTVEEAKAKYAYQVKHFGCPFAWLLGINDASEDIRPE